MLAQAGHEMETLHGTCDVQGFHIETVLNIRRLINEGATAIVAV